MLTRNLKRWEEVRLDTCIFHPYKRGYDLPFNIFNTGPKEPLPMLDAPKWYIRYNDNPEAALRIFCFHHAGGGASTYFHWAEHLSRKVEMIAIQLPGRENRFAEPLTNDLKTIIINLCEGFELYQDKPFLMLGHSLGALISFEFIKAIYRSYALYPRHMIVSAAKAPHFPFRLKRLSQLADKPLLEELKAYKGIEETALKSKELLEMFLPILKSDFSIGENYRFIESAAFPFDILALSGFHDPTVSEEEMLGWSAHTTGKFNLIRLPGGHFFIKEQQKKILQIINEIAEKHT